MRQCLFLFFAIFVTSMNTAYSAEKPNVLFIFADDLSYEAINSFAHTDIETPNINRLVKKGTTFTHTYNMGSWNGAVCIASRTMLITGRSVWHAESIYKQTHKEVDAGRLWPQHMKRAGYKTYMTGKWHIAAKAEKAFDVVKNVRAGMPQDSPSHYNRPQPGQQNSWSPSDPELGGYWTGGKHWSEVVADDALEFLSDASSSKSPFFMYIAFNAPHDPRQSPKEFVDKYPLDRIKIPENFLTEYPYKNNIGCDNSLRDERLAPFPRTEYAVKVHRQEYYALITHLDHQIGKILNKLEETKKASNTYIIFTADHGLAVGHHGLMGKQNMYEHSLRVPFMIVGPDVPQNKKIDATVYLQDAMATSLDIAGISKPDYVEFHSLLPLLNGKSSPAARKSIYAGYLNLQRAIIHDQWKLIVYPEAKAQRLYNLKEDPQEMKDLASAPENKAKKEHLFQLLKNEQQILDDKLILE